MTGKDANSRGEDVVNSANLPQFISKHVVNGDYFFLNLTSRQHKGLTVACGGRERCAPDYRIERNDFSFIGIEYIVSGNARLTIGDERYDLSPGSVFGYLPHTAVSIENAGENPLRKYFVDISGDEAETLFKQSPLGELKPCFLQSERWIGEIFQQIVSFGSTGSGAAQRSCDLLVEHMLLQLGESGHDRVDANSEAYKTYQRCKEILEKNYVSLSSAAELAKQAYVNQAYLSRLFKRFDDEAPYRKLVRLKLNLAARLLLHSRSSVKMIAQEVGISDPFHFSRLFKQTYGISPRYFPKSIERGV